MMSDQNQDNDFIDDDFEDDDFYNGDGGSTSKPGLFSNPILAIGAVVGGVAVILMGILLFGGGDPAPSRIVANNEDVRQAPGTENLTPQQRAAIEDANRQRREDAEDRNEPFIPIPTKTIEDAQSVENVDEQDPLMVWEELQRRELAQRAQRQPGTGFPNAVQNQQQFQSQPNPQLQALEQERNQALTELANAMSSQMQAIVDSEPDRSIKSLAVGGYQRGAFGQDPFLLDANGNGIVDGNDGFNVPNVPVVIEQILPAGEIEYGQILIEANSDVPGPVMASVMTGPFAGGKVIGRFQRQQEFLVVQFNLLAFEQETYQIDAVAIDPNTNMTGVRSSINRRWFRRVVLPAAARFVEGVAQAASEEQQEIVVTGEVVVQNQPELDTEEELFEGLEEAANQISQVLNQTAQQQQPLVRLFAGTPIGVLFLQPVIENAPEDSPPFLVNSRAGETFLGSQESAIPQTEGFGLGTVQTVPTNTQFGSPMGQQTPFNTIIQQQPQLQQFISPQAGGLTSRGVDPAINRVRPGQTINIEDPRFQQLR